MNCTDPDSVPRCARVPVGSHVVHCFLVVLIALVADVPVRGDLATTSDLEFKYSTGNPGYEVADSVKVLGVTFFYESAFASRSRDIANVSRLQAEFPGLLPAPGLAQISLTQIPVSGQFKARGGVQVEVGARAQVFPWWTPEVSQGLDLFVETNGISDGSLQSPFSGHDETINGIKGIGIPGILEVDAGAVYSVENEVNFIGIWGTLAYSRRGSSVTGLQEVIVDRLSYWGNQPMEVLLDEPGIYDFHLLSPKLRVLFSTYENLTIGMSAKFLDWETGTVALPFAAPVGKDPFNYYWLDGPGYSDWFSVEVQSPGSNVVPEPAAWAHCLWLAAMGATCYRRWSRRR